MRGGTWALVLATVLAGCAGAAPKEQTAETNVTRVDATMPDGRSGTIIAFNETNRTESGAGGLQHAHDYWAGRERVTLVDDRFEMGLAGQAPAFGAAVTIALPARQLVFEGTGHIDLALSAPERRACPAITLNGLPPCTDEVTGSGVADPTGGPTGLHLALRNAATSAWQDLGDVSWGKTVSYAIADAKMTDMPHATHTLWAFRVTSSDPSMETLAFHFKAEAIRTGGEIALWPGHPEFYAAGQHTREVLHAPVESAESGIDSWAPGVPQKGATETAAAKLVSYGTKSLHVAIDVADLQSTNPALPVTAWYLWVHNASGLWSKASKAQMPVGAHLEWSLPVDPDGMDSPYADGSRWGFLLQGISESAQAHISCTGCAPYSVKYDIIVTASDLPLPSPPP